jgi:parallel beta-helix repeat protein
MKRKIIGLSSLALLGIIIALIGCTISPPYVSQVIYVSKDGDDSNDGLSSSTPIYTLPKAMEIANQIDHSQTVEIKITIGGYFPDDGLNGSGDGFVINRPNTTISGGWDNNFKFVAGKTELNGEGHVYHVIKIENATNVILKNLIVKGGSAYDTNANNFDNTVGSGIFVKNVSYLTVENSVEICSNGAFGGGGMCLFNSQNNRIKCSIYDNSIFGIGGGIFLTNSHDNTISGNIYNNTALEGGGIFIGGSSGNKIEAQIFSNKASQRGGGGKILTSSNITLSGSVYNNMSRYGGGLYLEYSDHFTNTGYITNNMVTNTGGGIYTNAPHTNSSFGHVENNKLTNGTINNFN